jgi:hypothetical protein
MSIPGPRDTLLHSKFDDSTRRTLVSVFDRVWPRCGDRSEINGYRIAGSILELANSGVRSQEDIERRVSDVVRRSA